MFTPTFKAKPDKRYNIKKHMALTASPSGKVRPANKDKSIVGLAHKDAPRGSDVIVELIGSGSVGIKQDESEMCIIDEFNAFIKKWCQSAPHLLDNDENDGELFREKLRAITAERDEWIADRDRWIARREDEYKRAEGLLKERDELLQKLQRLEDAIRNEPEFPGEMPEGMAQTIQEIGLTESLRLIVRMTKNNILKQGGLKP